jgi:hypothetical protein
MAEIIQLRSGPHDEVQQLLPWLVNGTLAPDEAARVEAHLADCAECRGELVAERQLAAAVQSISLDSEGDWERLEQRLNGEAPARIRPFTAVWRKRVPLGWAVASPFAVAAAFALVFVNVTPRQPAEPQYRALGSTAAMPTANLVVQFQPATRVSDMQGALESVNARMVDGPTGTGAYLLRVDQPKRELALKTLRDNQAIALAEPIDAPARE